MIYYPGFEMKNKEWLKFALLYFEELRPIIPYMNVKKSEYLSETAITIMENTNLIKPYRPLFEEGVCASVIACEEFDRYLQHPERYSIFFSESNKSDILSKWRNPNFQTCNLYEGKYSDEFFRYCIDNDLAHRFSGGIRISKDLAFIYMSFLADLISKNNECDMFTEISRYNILLQKNDLQLTQSQNLHFRIVKSHMEFNVPLKIHDIPIDKIIELRGDRNFDECRRSYMREVKKYLHKRELDPRASFDECLRIKKDLARIIEILLGSVASIYLSVSSMLSLGEGQSSPYEVIAASYMDICSIKDIANIPKYIADLKNKKQAQRYFGKIKDISQLKHYNGR